MFVIEKKKRRMNWVECMERNECRRQVLVVSPACCLHSNVQFLYVVRFPPIPFYHAHHRSDGSRITIRVVLANNVNDYLPKAFKESSFVMVDGISPFTYTTHIELIHCRSPVLLLCLNTCPMWLPQLLQHTSPWSLMPMWALSPV